MIGILTFSNTLNYGALLQEYALYKTISSEFINVEIIDYHNQAIEKRELPSTIRDIKGLKEKIKYVLLKSSKKKKKFLFDEFIKNNVKHSFKVDAKNFDSLNKYSKIIVGSDQVWNLNLTAKDYNFYLEGIDDIKKYSYAASFGYSQFNEEKEKCIDLLSKFNNLYVRELEAVSMLENEGLKATHVLDPTFLLSKSEWINNLNLNNKSKEKYILVYFLKNDKENLPIIKKYAKEKNLKIKYINITPKKVYGVDEIKSCGPKEFLNLILNAEVVFAGSYHGITLSLIFNKNVFYMLDKNKYNFNSRINTLIQLFSLENYELNNYNLENSLPLDYKKINNIIKNEREKSLNLLRGLLYEA